MLFKRSSKSELGVVGNICRTLTTLGLLFCISLGVLRCNSFMFELGPLKVGYGSKASGEVNVVEAAFLRF